MLFRRIRVVHTRSFDAEPSESIKNKLAQAEERALAAEEELRKFQEANLQEATKLLVEKITRAITSDRVVEEVMAKRLEIEGESWEDLSDEERAYEIASLKEALKHGLSTL